MPAQLFVARAGIVLWKLELEMGAMLEHCHPLFSWASGAILSTPTIQQQRCCRDKHFSGNGKLLQQAHSATTPGAASETGKRTVPKSLPLADK
jgi:hypothetical protein